MEPFNLRSILSVVCKRASADSHIKLRILHQDNIYNSHNKHSLLIETKSGAMALMRKMVIMRLVGSLYAVDNDRDDKLLNVFNVIRFPNDACNASANTYGVCYSASECRTKGGLALGTCASSFGVCCSFTGSCGGSTQENNTYFASTSSDTSPCMFSVCKSSDDICQIRLNFDAFDIAQPNTKTLQSLHPGRNQCQNAQFTASSAGPASPTICGTNQAYHMILEVVQYGQFKTTKTLKLWIVDCGLRIEGWGEGW